MPYNPNKPFSCPSILPLDDKMFDFVIDSLKRNGFYNRTHRERMPTPARMRKILEFYSGTQPKPIKFCVSLEGRTLYIGVVGWTPQMFSAELAKKDAADREEARKYQESLKPRAAAQNP